MEDLAHGDAALGEVVTRVHNVGPTQCRFWKDPGAAEVTSVPNATEQAEPGGVIWTTRNASLWAISTIQPPTQRP